MRRDWRGRVGYHLGGQRADFLGLSREGAELFAPIDRPQLHHLGEGSGRGQALRQVKARIYILLGDLDNFTV